MSSFTPIKRSSANPFRLKDVKAPVGVVRLLILSVALAVCPVVLLTSEKEVRVLLGAIMNSA